MKECRRCSTGFVGHPNKRYCTVECRTADYAVEARERTARWRLANAERAQRADHNKHLIKKYGITLEHYEVMWNVRRGRCDICRRTADETGDPRRLAVDHCHKTGQVRGLLCRFCNTAIGQLQESTQVLQNAIEYLEMWNSG